MYDTAFDIVALAMRYWFVLIVAYILFRLVQNVLLEFSSERTARKRAAGYALGLIEVVEPVNSPMRGKTFALKRENTIGSARKCDIRLQSNSIDALHAAVYQKGNQVLLSDYGTRRGVYLNGRRIQRDVPLFDGDEITIGNVVMLLHISGIEGADQQERDERDDQDKYYADEADEEAEEETEDEEEPEEESDSYDGEFDEDKPDDEQDDEPDEDEEPDEDDESDEPDAKRQDSNPPQQNRNIGRWDAYGDRRGQDDIW